MGNLKELRIKANFSQEAAAKHFGVSLRSYRDYENNSDKTDSVKYKYFVNEFEKMLYIDEETGLLTINEIREICGDVFKEYNVSSCYLFGSYAKGKETPRSDVDLLIDTDADGIRFLALNEKLRIALRKAVDLLDVRQVIKNPELLKEVLKDGIKIYG